MDIKGKSLDFKHIVENRKLPGLLIFDKSNGDLLFRNPLVDSRILDEKEYSDWLVEQFNVFPASTLQKQSAERVEDDFSMERVVKTVICFDKQYYGMLAFTLANESHGQGKEIVVVLVEEISGEISSERLDDHLRRMSGSFRFSPRETEVLQELQLGRTDKMIASTLQISPETVHGYVKSIRGKMGVSTRTAIMHKLFTQPA